jgi:hypothetical protein
MKRYLTRLLLFACAFYFVLPAIPGIAFHGNFLHAILAGALFAFIGWIVEFLAITFSAILAIGTLGMALLLLIPAWILGFWFLPAVVLRIVASLMPSLLSFDGWLPAIGGGLIMLLIGIITSGDAHRKVRQSRKITLVT